MSVLLITYDLNKETKRPPIVLEIKELGSSWVKLSESSYAISTSKTPDTVYKKLKSMIDKDDVIYIIPLKKPWNGYGFEKVNQWLSKNLP